MAKRNPVSGENERDIDRAAYRVDTITGDKFRATHDETTHDKLDQVISSLGGSLDTTPLIYNLNIISAGTEVSLALPENTKKFLIKSRSKGQLRLAYISGCTNMTYLTLPLGSSFVDESFYTNQTIYFQSSKPGDVIEIVAYT